MNKDTRAALIEYLKPYAPTETVEEFEKGLRDHNVHPDVIAQSVAFSRTRRLIFDVAIEAYRITHGEPFAVSLRDDVIEAQRAYIAAD